MQSNPQVDLINEVGMTKQLLKLQRLNMFNPRLLSIAMTMESVEQWTVDKLNVDANGVVVGVDDEHGTGHQRMEVLRQLQDVINAPELKLYAEKAQFRPELDMTLIDLLSRVKARRFMVCVYALNQSVPGYMAHLLEVVLDCDHENMSAHIVRSRIERFNQLNLFESLLSKESLALIQSVLQKISKN